MKKVAFGFVSGLLLLTPCCMTTYDANGRPVQSVDPGLAVAGAAAAGLIGYAIANDSDNHYHNYHHGYYRPRPGYHGRYRRY